MARVTPDAQALGLHVHAVHARDPECPAVCEAGLVGTSITWTLVQTLLAERHGRTSYSYDRRGLGQSGPRVSSLSLDGLSRDMHDLVEAMSIRRPFVLVAHSFGALIARAYAHHRPSDLLGLVLVDPFVPDDWVDLTIRTGVRSVRVRTLARLGAWLAHIGLMRLGLWGLLRRGHGNAGPVLGLSPSLRRLARELAKIPPDDRNALRGYWCRPSFFRTLGAYLEALPRLAAEALTLSFPAHLPVVVLSGAHQPVDIVERQREESTHHEIVPGTGHWITFDRPDVVAQAVQNLVTGRIPSR